MRFFAIAALAATAAAEAIQYGAPVAQGWEDNLVARSEECTTSLSSVVAPVETSSPCPSQTTIETTITITNTVIATPGAPPKDGEPPISKTVVLPTSILTPGSSASSAGGPSVGEPTTTTTVESTTTHYITITKTVQHANSSTTSYVPSGSGIPVSGNATTSTGFNVPSLSSTALPSQFTGAAGQGAVSVAALFLGVVAAANFV